MLKTLSILFLTLCGMAAVASDEWPDFRGPWEDGRASAPGDTRLAGLPLRWSETENVKWKTNIPERGWSSPVVLNGQVWLTTATLDGKDFFAIGVDESNGAILCDQHLFHCEEPEPLGNDLNCYASPSPVIEPGRVYISFGSYGTACLDTARLATLWKRNDLPCRHYRGPGSSPILWKNLLILTMDGVDVDYMVALDKNTGRTVWKTDRTTHWNDLNADGRPMGGGDFRKAFSTPIIIDVNGAPLMLTAASKAAYGYDPVTGRELWKFSHDGYTPASRPLFDHGLALFSTGNGRSELLALRPDGHGDLPPGAVVWRATKALPRRPSATVDNGLLFMCNDGGIASCLQTSDGAEVWRERIGGEYSASALYGDGRVYFFSQEGKTTVVRAGRSFEPLATNELADGFMASPAVAGHALYLRTRSALYRIEDSAKQ